MKRIFYGAFILLALTSTIITSCKKGNLCESGFEGASCTTKFSEKYISSTGWAATDNVTSSTAGTALGTFTYIPIITVINASQIKVRGMSGFADFIIVFFLTSSKEFNFTSFNSDNKFITGTGSISTDERTINITYTVIYSDGTKDNITGTWSKN